MAFDWQNFLKDYEVPFVTSGPNVGSGHIAIKCPFCPDDPSEHMSLNLSTGAWRCWRDGEHSGRRPRYLLNRLVGNIVSVKRIEADYGHDSPPEISRALNDELEGEAPTIPPHFVHISEMVLRPAFRMHLRYLQLRGYEVADLMQYEIYGCWQGEWKDRIIFPFQMGGRVMTWLGRTVNNLDLRYKALSRDGDLEGNRALLQTTNLLWNWDELCSGGRYLILVEGIFDALKLDIAGRRHGIRATCVSTRSISRAQKDLLIDLFFVQEAFKGLALLPDSDGPNGVGGIGWLERELAWFHPSSMKLPRGVKDAADLNKEQVTQTIRELLGA